MSVGGRADATENDGSCLHCCVQELTEVQEKFRLQSKELKDAIGQRKLAMTEYTEVSDKYVLYLLFSPL